MIRTFEPHRGRLHHRNFNRQNGRVRLLQPGAIKFIDAVGNLLSGDVDGFAETVGRELPAEIAGGLGVSNGVFLRGGRRLVCGEHYVGGIEC
jgi:hypothetical protein